MRVRVRVGVGVGVGVGVRVRVRVRVRVLVSMRCVVGTRLQSGIGHTVRLKRRGRCRGKPVALRVIS